MILGTSLVRVLLFLIEFTANIERIEQTAKAQQLAELRVKAWYV